MRGLLARLACAAALSWALPVAAQEPAPTPAPDADATVTVLAGGLVSAGADSAMSPWIGIAIEAPVASGSKAPRLLVDAELSALPGESLSAEDPSTWRSIEFRVGVSQPIATALRFHLFAAAGFATRLPVEAEPRDKTARWGTAGLRFSGKRGVLELGVGGDQRLDGRWQAAVQLAGRVKLWEAESGPLKGGELSLVGNACLGLDLSGRYAGLTGGRRDVVRIGIAVGR